MTKRKNSEWVFRNEKIYKPGEQGLIETILKVRGLSQSDEVDNFLNPPISEVPSAGAIYDSESAAKQIIQALKANETIFIHGDYDCDGICATAILWEYLYRNAAQKINSDSKIVPYIPHRIDQGYGLSESSIDEMVQKGAQLIITVDCGIRDKELIESYIKKSPKLKFIVTDHHLPPEDFILSDRFTLVHQLHPSHRYIHDEVCGSTVALLLAQTIFHQLGDEGKLMPTTPGLDLVALATISDLIPLTGVNRTLVKAGIDLINQSPRQGLKALKEVSGIKDSVNEYHLGYIIGPRINATGRIGDPLDALRLLLTGSPKIANVYARKINNLNLKRQEITEEYFKLALQSIGRESQRDRINFIVGDDWHEGIIGLVANKLTEFNSSPTIVISSGSEVKGSARSVEGIHITAMLEEFSKYLVKYGGHALAAGFTVKEGLLEEFKSEVISWAEKNIDLESISKRIKIDLKLSLKDIKKSTVQSLDLLRPFGMKNPRPLFLLEGVMILEANAIGRLKNHLKITVTDSSHKAVDCILFDCSEDISILQVGAEVDLVGSLSINSWNSEENCQFEIREWQLAGQ